MVKACVIALLSAALARILSEMGFRGVGIFAAIASVSLILWVIPYIESIGGVIERVGSSVGVGEEVASILKIIGIGYLGGISADLCRDLGEGGIARSVDAVTGVEILLIAAPYFINIIELGVGLL